MIWNDRQMRDAGCGWVVYELFWSEIGRDRDETIGVRKWEEYCTYRCKNYSVYKVSIIADNHHFHAQSESKSTLQLENRENRWRGSQLMLMKAKGKSGNMFNIQFLWSCCPHKYYCINYGKLSVFIFTVKKCVTHQIRIGTSEWDVNNISPCKHTYLFYSKLCQIQ